MPKHTITVEVDIAAHGYDGDKCFPAFYESAAELSDDRTELAVIGRSLVNPFVFYLFAKPEAKGPNSTFVATVNITPAIQGIISQWPDIKDIEVARAAHASAAEEATGEPAPR